MYSCQKNVKEAAYKGLVNQILQYGNSVLQPHGLFIQEGLVNVQLRAASFVAGNQNNKTGHMTGIFEKLKWESLKKRRDGRLIFLYNI